MILKRLHPTDAIHKVTGKSGNSLGDDHVDLPVHGILHELLEALAVCRVGTGKAVVHIAAGILPIGILLDPLHILLDLQVDRQLLIDIVCGHATVGSHTKDAIFLLRNRCGGNLVDVPSVLGIELAHQCVLLPLLPLSQFPEIPANAEIGTDVTELLGVRKWEIEERATTGGTVIGNLPYDIPHTDETRVQEEPELIQAFAGLEYYISTKMDGSSHSIGIDENGFHVTGHNYEYKDDGNSSFYELVKARGYREKMEAFAKENGLTALTIQGELCAPGIQRNRLRLSKPEWYVFTVRENGKRVGLNRMLEVCAALGMEHVPIEEVGVDLPSKYPTVEALLERADGDYPNGGKKEGIVVRPTEPVFCPLISASLSMKIVSNKYLLKNE